MIETLLIKLLPSLSFKAFTFSSIDSGEFSQPYPVNPCRQTQIFLPSGQNPCPLQIGFPGHISINAKKNRYNLTNGQKHVVRAFFKNIPNRIANRIESKDEF